MIDPSLRDESGWFVDDENALRQKEGAKSGEGFRTERDETKEGRRKARELSFEGEKDKLTLSWKRIFSGSSLARRAKEGSIADLEAPRRGIQEGREGVERSSTLEGKGRSSKNELRTSLPAPPSLFLLRPILVLRSIHSFFCSSPLQSSTKKLKILLKRNHLLLILLLLNRQLGSSSLDLPPLLPPLPPPRHELLGFQIRKEVLARLLDDEAPSEIGKHDGREGDFELRQERRGEETRSQFL